ncbi:hypothetical protein AAVH_02239 [Aphelenchoides avenae]|nr:hypothetical protein AAVH_02239 [Aphelenchus avenae]
MTKVSHAVTNVGWTAEEVDALNTLPQRYRHLFPEGFESAPPLKLKKRAVAIAGTKLQRLRDVLYGAEKDL